ncbi:MAG: TatD family hydrolase [Alphaproteobacteria bacterium]|nr:TatD family hydrolase [Alphaproteobacteria bacterium]
MLADSHCHLEDNEGLDGVIMRARQAGVEYILDAGANINHLAEHLAITRRYAKVYTCVGVHPHEASEFADLRAADILRACENDGVIAIGEAGLDYFYDYAPRQAQIDLLQEHIAAAQEAGLPLVIHNRESDDDMIQLLSSAYEKKEFKGIIHCYSSSARLAEVALAMGFYISASGIITFKKSEDIRANFAQVPLDRLLVETDAPYLAPVPKRGEINEPANVVLTAHKLAEIKQVSFEEIAKVTTDNFRRLTGV